MAAMAQRMASSLFSRVVTRVKTFQRPVIYTQPRAAFVAGAICAMPMLTGEDFFEHTFVTEKDPDDIVDFYSTEDFLQILGVFPFAIHFVLAGVEWDTERENTMSVHSSMEISFELTEREEETPDGETVVAFFQKEERFKNYIPLTRFLMWDQTQCYGYNRRDDGKCEVFHRGKNFYGPLPVRLLVQLHARYVIWATEKHINSKASSDAFSRLLPPYHHLLPPSTTFYRLRRPSAAAISSCRSSSAPTSPSTSQGHTWCTATPCTFH